MPLRLCQSCLTPSSDSNIINAAEDPGKTLEDLIVHHEFFDTASRALEIIAPREETYDGEPFPISTKPA